MNKQPFSYSYIAAMIPTYTPEGDSTMIIKTDGSQQQINRPLHILLKGLARSYSIDLAALKEKAILATEKSNFQPLYLAPDLVLCPLKVRIPRVSGDIAKGYINFHAIIDVINYHIKPYHSTIRLIGGTELPVIWTKNTVKQHLQQARLVISHTAYDPEIPPELSIHLYHIIKAFYRLPLLRHSPEQNFMSIPKQSTYSNHKFFSTNPLTQIQNMDNLSST